jgi:hypothetical protein
LKEVLRFRNETWSACVGSIVVQCSTPHNGHAPQLSIEATYSCGMELKFSHDAWNENI